MTDPDIPDTPLVPPGAEAPEHVGTALMKDDGTLEMMLRAVSPRGAIGEAMMVVAPGDPRYAAMVKHLGGIQPGESKLIPPFPSE